MKDKLRKTPFGNMLNTYRYQKQLVVDRVKSEMRKKAGLDNPKYQEEFEFRESTVHAQDGTITTKVELWKRIDVERVKISTSVLAEKVEDEKEVKKDDDWGI